LENRRESKRIKRIEIIRLFYETGKDNEFVSPQVTQISWMSRPVIISGAKEIEEISSERQYNHLFYIPKISSEVAS